MELGPSTIGYRENEDGGLEPLFEKYKSEYQSTFVTILLQDAAIEFVQDYVAFFEDLQENLVFQRDMLSAPFEYYLHDSKSLDRQLFLTLPFEDDLGEGQINNALEFWNNEIWKNEMNIFNEKGKVLPNELEDLYIEGLFVKTYQLINIIFPKESRTRNVMKKVVDIFIY